MVTSAKPIGVLLLTFGGPDSLDAIEPFMTNVMGGRKPPSALLEKMTWRYKLIGGKSPLPEVTRLQAKLLEQALNTAGENYKVYIGMLHWRPFIKDALSQMARDGVEEMVAVSLSPHFAGVTTGAYANAIESANTELEAGIKLDFAPGWFDHPLFIKGLAEKLEEVLNKFPAESRSEVDIIFTAHSLPVAHIQSGDPYVSQMLATASALVKETGIKNWHLAYQSKGGGQGDWLGPEVEGVMDHLAAQGKKDVLVSPIGFATDHIETLYDIDVAQRNYAESLGLNFQRASALNTSPKLIQVLAEAVRTAF